MNYRIYKFLIVLLIIINFFLPLGYVPLFDYDEGAFSEATREMLSSGNYLTTYLNGDLRFDKPILIYWFQALFAKIFGLNEFAMRFPSALASAIWAGAIYLFSKKYFNEKIAIIATLFMVSSLQINIIAKAAIADALLNMTIAISIFLIYSYIESKKEKFLLWAFFIIAIGTLTKGPVAIMIPLISTFIFMAIKKELKEFFKMIFNLKGIAIFLIVAMPWYILEYLEQGEKFIDGFFLKHNLSRFSSAMENHSGKYYYYFVVILIGMLPFSIYFTKIFTKIKEIFKNDLLLFLFIYFAFVFIFFTFSGTKLPHYIIYGYTPIFILMAYFFDRILSINLIATLAFLLILLFLPDIALLFKDKIHDVYVVKIIESSKDTFNIYYKISAIISILVIAISHFLKIKDLTKLFILGATFSIFINFSFIKAYANLTQVPIKEAALITKSKNKDIIMRNRVPIFLFYSQRISKRGKANRGDIVFVKEKSIKDYKNYTMLYSKYGIYLIELR